MGFGKNGIRPLRYAAAALIFAAGAPGYAQEQVAAFDIPPQELSSALRAFARASGEQVTFDARSVRGKKSPALKGTYTHRAALALLLRDSGLVVESRPSGLLVIRPSAATEGSAAGSAEATAAAGDDIVVTGSRLHRTSFDSPIPIVVIDKEDISEHGYIDLGEALSDLPAVDTGINLSNGQTSTQTNGLSTISLRGLGQNRTLTLIDGHRTVSNVGNSNAVSLSTIPTFLVDRVEVSTGGASAVYGSDAIAGVVNIITDSDLNGIKSRIVGAATNDGGGDSTEYSFAIGRKFLGDRLYVMGAATYEKQYALQAADRDWALESVSYSASSNTTSSPDLSSYIPGGRFLNSRGAYYYDETGLKSGFVTAANGYDDRSSGTLIVPRESWSGAFKMRYEFSDSLKFSGQFLYSRITTHSEREPYYIGYQSTYGVNDEYTLGRIARTNPYVPAVIRAAATSSGVDFRRRLTELGRMGIDNRRETLRGWAGLQGKVFNDWDWDLTYGYGRFEQNQVRTNGVNYQHVQYALNATTASDGTIVCADANARAGGCVPLNLFGLGSISEAAANYIRGNAWYQAINRQDTVSGNLTGSPFSLPAGPVQLAVGFELRRDKTQTRTDELTASGYSNYAYIPQYSGKVEAAEGYVETSLPLLRDQPFAYRLSVDGAARVARYNLAGVGTTLSYRAGAQWAPVKGLGFRATYSRAQRAPDTTELYSPARDDYDTVVDICSGVTAATTGTVAQNCRSNAGIAAAIAANGVFTQDSTSVNAPNSGNIDLKEETAYTFTGGVVVNPGFLPGFQASVDYFDVKVNDAISSLSNANLLLECYSDASGNTNRFCDTITRDSEGQITRILNQEENLNELRARGIDVAVSYSFKLRSLNIPGRFSLTGNYTHKLELGTTYSGIGGLEVNDYLGEVGDSKDVARGSLSWSTPRVMLKWTTVYIGPAVDDNTLVGYFAEQGITNPLYLHVPHYWRHDLSFRLTPSRRDPNLRFFGTIKNILNSYGPFLPDGTESGNKYNYNSVYGVSGRTFSLGLQVQF